MAIFVSSVFATLLGSCVVYLTSPTIAHLFVDDSVSLLVAHSLAIDALFAILIGFLILCYIETRWVAINQSFPYTFHLKRNLGLEAFNFQLVVFELWHTNKLNRYVHMVCLFCEEFFWLYIIKGVFGMSGLALANLLSMTQGFTQGDWKLTLSIGVLNAAYSFAGLKAFEQMDPLLALNICKVALFWIVVVRTAVHAAEPLPPTYDSEADSFDDGWSTLR